MITFPMVFAGLVVSCGIVSVVYALISPGEPERVVSETVSNAKWMIGGIVALGIAIVLVGWLVG